MKKVMQTKFAGDKAGGNCLQAATASLLELPLEDVPHFIEQCRDRYFTCWWNWVCSQGYEIEVLYEPKDLKKDEYYIAIGPTERGTNHACIFQNGVLVHDPHPSGAGLTLFSRGFAIRRCWIFYMLRCNDGSIYSGITTDIEERVRKHNNGIASKYTRSRRPVSLVYMERVEGGRSKASKREAAVKSFSKAKKEQMISKYLAT